MSPTMSDSFLTLGCYAMRPVHHHMHAIINFIYITVLSTSQLSIYMSCMCGPF